MPVAPRPRPSPFEKAGVTTRAAATLFATRNGLVGADG